MKFTLKEYEGHPYIEYYDEENGKTFTNSEYFIFDVICEEFKAIMSSTGGFCAEMTTRTIKKLNIPCTHIMLCQTPDKDNLFQFQFVYLDEDRNVLNVEWDNNYFDYEYFKEKFSPCIIQRGCIFDLLQYDYLKEVTKQFKAPTVHFDFKVDGEEVTAEDILICKDLCFLKEEYIEKFREYGVSYAELKYKFDCFNPHNFEAKFVKEDGSYLQNWQGVYGYKTFDKFEEENKTEDFDTQDFDTSVSIAVLRHLAEHFEIMDREESLEL